MSAGELLVNHASPRPPNNNLAPRATEEVAKAFVSHFYQTFDSGVDNLAGLYVSWGMGGLMDCGRGSSQATTQDPPATADGLQARAIQYLESCIVHP